jgi:rubrerythrin
MCLFRYNLHTGIMELYEIIKGCIEMEHAVAKIYNIFVRLFPEEKLFWQDLARDEQDHASWLSNVKFFEMIDLLPSAKILPTKELIDNSLNFAEKRGSLLKRNPVDLEDALKLALHLEESMVEIFANHLIANILGTSDESLNRKILMAEKIHKDKIEDMMITKGFLQLS